MFNAKRIKGMDCPSKILISKGDKPLIFVNGQAKASFVMQYLEGFKTDNEFLEEMNNNLKTLKLLKKERLKTCR